MTGSENLWRPSGTCALFVCDVVSYGDSRRTNAVQAHIRKNLYGLLKTSFDQAEIPFSATYREDRGDGVLLAVPLEHDPALLVTIVTDLLRAGLGRYNGLSSDAARIELRVSVHLGIADHDENGLIGTEVNHVFRLLEAPLFKAMVKDSGATIGLIVSERFHEEIVQRDKGLISVGDYLPMPVSVKETESSGWVRMFGGAAPALPGEVAPALPESGKLQTKQSAEADRSASPTEVPPLEGMRIGPPALFALVECVLEIPAMLTDRGRDQVVEMLPQAIAVVIPRDHNARSDVYQIIKTCLDYPGGLQHFVQAIKVFHNGAMSVTRLEQTVAQALARL